MNVIQKMRANEQNYSKAEFKIYHTIFKKPLLVEMYTITMIADISKSSTSAVLRFCQRLGYNGYKDFRFDMIQYLKTADNSPEPVNTGANRIQSITGIFSESAEVMKTLNYDKFKQLATDLHNADAVYSLGLYRSFLAAEKLRMNLLDKGKLVFSGSNHIEFSHFNYTISAQSVTIIFSVSGEARDYHSFLTEITPGTTKVYLITCNPSPKLGKYIDHIFILPSTHNNKAYPLDELAIQIMFVEILTDLISNI